jgi:hypothetical protein
MFNKTKQTNSSKINELLLSEKYYRDFAIDDDGNCDWGKNSFLPGFLKHFTHVDTYERDEMEIRLQGWFKPTDSCSLPSCEVWGFDAEYGIFIASLVIKGDV